MVTVKITTTTKTRASWSCKLCSACGKVANKEQARKALADHHKRVH